MRRMARAVLMLAMLIGGVVAVEPAAGQEGEPSGTWVRAAKPFLYAGASLTPLADGRVLAVHHNWGTGSVSNAAVFDPATRSWAPTPPIPTPYLQAHTATLLADGRVLVAGGGEGEGAAHARSFVYDAGENTWTETGAMRVRRIEHTATRLPDGRVLVAGGSIGDGVPHGSTEIYDPATGTWAPGPELSAPRRGHTATLRPDGVLLVGGFALHDDVETNEILDPSAGTSRPAASLVATRGGHTMVALPSGDLLVAGGIRHDGACPAPERYDAGDDTWLAAPGSGLCSHASAAALPSGAALVIGGLPGMAQAWRYDDGGRWRRLVDAPDLDNGALAAVATGALLVGRRHESTAAVFAEAGQPAAAGAPRSVSVVRTAAGAEVRWLPPSDDGGSPVIGYRVYRFSPGGDHSAHSVSQTTFTDTAVQPDLPYVYRVVARTANGDGVPAADVVLSPAGWTTPPDVLATASASASGITVRWSTTWRGQDPPGSIRLYRGKTSDQLDLLHTELVPPSDSNVTDGMFTDTTAAPLEPYVYVVVAVTRNGTEGRSLPVSATLPLTMAVDADDADGAASPVALVAGATYRVLAEGTYRWSAAGLADAECVKFMWAQDWRPRRLDVPKGRDLLDLRLNGGQIDWAGTGGPGTCDWDDHSYTATLTPQATGPLHAQIDDDVYDDNSGSLTVTIERIS